MNVYQNFINSLLSLLIQNNENTPQYNSKVTNLIRKNKVNLSNIGDLTIPLDQHLWDNYHIKIDKQFLDSLNNCTSISKNWTIQIDKIQFIYKNSISLCNVFLERKSFYEYFYKIFTEENYGQVWLSQSNTRYKIHLEKESDLDNLTVTEYRLVLIKSILEQLFCYIKFKNEYEAKEKNILVTYKQQTQNDDYNETIACGCVFDPRDNSRKAAKVTAKEYILMRSTDMQLTAQHKYGLRVKNEQVFIDLVNKLGRAAAIVDFTEVKHTNAVGIVINNRQPSSKGAAFILYNSARLEVLFRTFNERVAEGYYPALPSFGAIDFNLLKEEEEWEIFYSFILEFPNLIEKSVGNIDTGEISLHLICSFLQNLVGLFSTYYRRVKILTENRPHLLPVMHARLTLLHCMRIVFNKLLTILSIEPVTQM